MQREHVALNELCNQCGRYGDNTCAECIVEILRQRMITETMKRIKKETCAVEQDEWVWA